MCTRYETTMYALSLVTALLLISILVIGIENISSINHRDNFQLNVTWTITDAHLEVDACQTFNSQSNTRGTYPCMIAYAEYEYEWAMESKHLSPSIYYVWEITNKKFPMNDTGMYFDKIRAAIGSTGAGTYSHSRDTFSPSYASYQEWVKTCETEKTVLIILGSITGCFLFSLALICIAYWKYNVGVGV